MTIQLNYTKRDFYFKTFIAKRLYGTTSLAGGFHGSNNENIYAIKIFKDYVKKFDAKPTNDISNGDFLIGMHAVLTKTKNVAKIAEYINRLNIDADVLINMINTPSIIDDEVYKKMLIAVLSNRNFNSEKFNIMNINLTVKEHFTRNLIKIQNNIEVDGNIDPAKKKDIIKNINSILTCLYFRKGGIDNIIADGNNKICIDNSSLMDSIMLCHTIKFTEDAEYLKEVLFRKLSEEKSIENTLNENMPKNREYFLKALIKAIILLRVNKIKDNPIVENNIVKMLKAAGYNERFERSLLQEYSLQDKYKSIKGANIDLSKFIDLYLRIGYF